MNNFKQIYNIVKSVIKEDLINKSNQNNYLLIDGRDNAIIGEYNTDRPDDAIYDANSMAEADPSGLYLVCKAHPNGKYNIHQDCIYKTNNESRTYIKKYIQENIDYLLKQVILKT